ncbi:MAG: hypothetical protein PUI87_02630, partial [Mycoplasmataceae bacterium]|nr:hypothetical protein [Mycoplasmataceae bacterium]
MKNLTIYYLFKNDFNYFLWFDFLFFLTEHITYQATPITVKQEIATIIHIHQFDDSDIVVIFNLMILEEDLEGSWTLVATTFSSC